MTSWVEWFLRDPRSHYFARVSPSYLLDNFNFFGLRGKTRDSQQTFRCALDQIRGAHLPAERRPAEWTPDVDRCAAQLYGLVHARYLLTSAALSQMHEKYTRAEFPRCPRAYCDGQVCLPYGPSDDVDVSVLRIFCPRCRDVYAADDRICETIDGGFFGPSWVHLFLQKYEALVPRGQARRPAIRLFGFKIDEEDASEED
jgi:casein kinase II subunit beta